VGYIDETGTTSLFTDMLEEFDIEESMQNSFETTFKLLISNHIKENRLKDLLFVSRDTSSASQAVKIKVHSMV